MGQTNITINEKEKELIQKAAKLDRRSMSSFIVKNSIIAANKILRASYE